MIFNQIFLTDFILIYLRVISFETQRCTLSETLRLDRSSLPPMSIIYIKKKKNVIKIETGLFHKIIMDKSVYLYCTASGLILENIHLSDDVKAI